MAMSKQDFVKLADVLKRTRPIVDDEYNSPQVDRLPGKIKDRTRLEQWEMLRDQLADFCQSQNPRFMRDRWLAYIAGECGKNGGTVKGRVKLTQRCPKCGTRSNQTTCPDCVVRTVAA
jgi:hypothetical protein